MTAPTTSPAAQRYLAEVAGELADLPVEERADLLEDLGLHLAALDAEDDAWPVGVRLGTPAAYAAELRAAAGLPPRAAPARPHRRPADGVVRVVRAVAASRAAARCGPSCRSCSRRGGCCAATSSSGSRR